MPRDNGCCNRKASLFTYSALAALSSIVFTVLAAAFPASAAARNSRTQAAFFEEDLGVTFIPADTPIARNPRKFQQYHVPILEGVDTRLDHAFDNVGRSRLSSQTRRELEQELKDYHRAFHFMRECLAEADIHAVDATREPAQVAKEIRKIVQGSKN
jgi:hypothetical protein